jgi:ABC-type uncharacterized transport system substrate-binding protein
MRQMVGMTPDVILSDGITPLAALQPLTRTIPIVFAQVPDPIANGFVVSLARPGGNITGFALPEEAISAKRLELLKQIAPGVTRLAMIYDPTNPTGSIYLAQLEAAASLFGVLVSAAIVRDAVEIERAIDLFVSKANGGLIVVASPMVTANRDLIIALAARHKLPAIYPFRFFITGGGLASYGADNIDLYRRAASYVDRILKGEKPADLPVQQPTKYEMVINLKTAKALGLEVPPTLLARADEVIE